MIVNAGCQLEYDTTTPTVFIFQIQAAHADGQAVVREAIKLPAGCRFEAIVDPVTQNRIMRTVLGPGVIQVGYEATIETPGVADVPDAVSEIDFMGLPAETLPFLTPSRYCPSDTFTQFSSEAFGGMAPGHRRVQSICDWIFTNFRYQAGSTGPNSSAADVFKSGAGVCRDFAHLGISLCRALGIPARYVSVYAAGLQPQDFHATFQAFLNGPNGGAWYMFDPTRMSSADAVVRIAVGHDAADVAFAWPQAPVSVKKMAVWANAEGRTQNTRTSAAIPAVSS